VTRVLFFKKSNLFSLCFCRTVIAANKSNLFLASVGRKHLIVKIAPLPKQKNVNWQLKFSLEKTGVDLFIWVTSWVEQLRWKKH